jgi:hypothetical protein
VGTSYTEQMTRVIGFPGALHCQRSEVPNIHNIGVYIIIIFIGEF